MHSFDDLESKVLPEDPWRKFPLTRTIAMVSAMLTLLIDSYPYNKRTSKREGKQVNDEDEVNDDENVKPLEKGSNSIDIQDEVNDDKTSQLPRNKVIVQVQIKNLYIFLIS